MVYVSSMEMYGVLNLQDDQMVTEEMTGYLNPLALRSNYPESKRMWRICALPMERSA